MCAIVAGGIIGGIAGGVGYFAAKSLTGDMDNFNAKDFALTIGAGSLAGASAPVIGAAVAAAGLTGAGATVATGPGLFATGGTINVGQYAAHRAWVEDNPIDLSNADDQNSVASSFAIGGVINTIGIKAPAIGSSSIAKTFDSETAKMIAPKTYEVMSSAARSQSWNSVSANFLMGAFQNTGTNAISPFPQVKSTALRPQIIYYDEFGKMIYYPNYSVQQLTPDISGNGPR